jgi:hypothetical protein
MEDQIRQQGLRFERGGFGQLLVVVVKVKRTQKVHLQAAHHKTSSL